MKTLLAPVVFAALAGCGGRDFVRPGPNALTVGSTRYEQVLQTFGPPAKTSTGAFKGVPTTTALYAHAEVGPLGSSYAIRQMVCVFSDGVLVPYDYASSFDDGRTPLDEATIKGLKAGQRKAEVVAALGPPTGEAIYPVFAEKGHSLFRYTSLETHKIPFVPAPRETGKAATVSFDAVEKVLDTRFVESQRE